MRLVTMLVSFLTAATAWAALPDGCLVGYTGTQIHTDYQMTCEDGSAYEKHAPCSITVLDGGATRIECPSPIDPTGYVRVGYVASTPTPLPARTATPKPVDPLQPCRDKNPDWHWSNPGCPSVFPCDCLPGPAATKTPTPQATVIPRPTGAWSFTPNRVKYGWFPYTVADAKADRPAYATYPAGTKDALVKYGTTMGSIDYVLWAFPWDVTDAYLDSSLTEMLKIHDLAKARGKKLGAFVLEGSPFGWAQWLRDSGIGFMRQDATGKWVAKTGRELQDPIAENVKLRFMDPLEARGVKLLVVPYLFSWKSGGPTWPDGRTIPEPVTDQVFGKNVVDFLFYLDAMKAWHPTVEVIPQISNCSQSWGGRTPQLSQLIAAGLKGKGYPPRAQIERCIFDGTVPEKRPFVADCATLRAMEGAGLEVGIWDASAWVKSVGKELELCR